MHWRNMPIHLLVLLAMLTSTRLANAQDGGTPAATVAVDGRFDIGGRSLYLRCTGAGSPTVVIESFPIGASADWAQVEAGVARSNRVCIYDPAGFGLSDPPPPGLVTPKARCQDLWALLAAAGVSGPFVLAGFVVGADVVLACHRLFPDDVAGLVLVSPRGLDPETHDRFVAQLPAADQDAEMAGWTEGGGPEAAAEFAALPPGPPVPAIIIQGGLPEDAAPGWPADQLDAVLKSAQEQIAADVGARLVVASGVKGNTVLTDAPEVVITAIEEVAEAVRDPSSWAPPAASPAA